MALKALIGKLTRKTDRRGWQPAEGSYPRLMLLEHNDLLPLKDQGGLYVLWHRGVRPQWIYAGHTMDLGDALAAAQQDPDVVLYDRNDGVYVSWVDCPVESRGPITAHLRLSLQPAIEVSALDDLGPVDPETQPLEFSPPVD